MTDSLLTGLGLFLAAGGALAVLVGLGIHLVYALRGTSDPGQGRFRDTPYTEIAESTAAYAKYANTPLWVKIQGTIQATNRGTTASPLSREYGVWHRTQCFNIAEGHRLMSEQVSPMPFFLNDASGSILMHPTGAITGLPQREKRVTRDPLRDPKLATHELNPQLQAVESILASGQKLVVLGELTRQGEQFFLDTKSPDAMVIADTQVVVDLQIESTGKTRDRWGSRMVTEGGAACVIGLLLWSLVVG